MSGVRSFVNSSFTQSDDQTLNDKCTKTWEISLNIYTYRYRQKPKDLGDVRDKGSLKMVTEARFDDKFIANFSARHKLRLLDLLVYAAAL